MKVYVAKLDYVTDSGQICSPTIGIFKTLELAQAQVEHLARIQSGAEWYTDPNVPRRHYLNVDNGMYSISENKVLE